MHQDVIVFFRKGTTIKTIAYKPEGHYLKFETEKEAQEVKDSSNFISCATNVMKWAKTVAHNFPVSAGLVHVSTLQLPSLTKRFTFTFDKLNSITGCIGLNF